jgi:mannose-6-phosphate isomerase-like protein (cupin superfamily)
VIHVAPNESHSTTRVLGVFNMCKATKQDTNGIFSFFVSTVPAGEGVPIHTHLQEDEAYYILEGTFEMYDVTHKHTMTVGPDSYVYVPRNVEHGFKNVGSDTGRMVLIITPGGLEGFFEGIGQVITDVNNPPPPLTGPPDFIKAGRIAAEHNITFVIPE